MQRNEDSSSLRREASLGVERVECATLLQLKVFETALPFALASAQVLLLLLLVHIPQSFINLNIIHS